ncbi:organic anion transporter 3 isoform X1 [Macaca nemestrina]|uniref:Solute carrier family 22 member 8 n=6 Tax=Cercopithecinae TaxID=9528 RepID=F7GJL4_MACMU|nr:organic anion transporter 3 [Macaca mulatta]XP_001115852.1 solute carrier family 22 member 8 isoform X1 [Macaca mulatta]XP_003909709.1 solute carrier family 22 member 8 isoform X1 [Papio anubis]XP_003909710.1 solute carrier family 22 member 8 isoform X1 [Papio anubis]XP_011718806.1 solute carrier family 22 member 8 [Macaca nemestrina]XP_011718807.1 solute carrier family 22 member 8 [Macaca nemestrina]XP_025212313.1 solute carrier family 22 member 8 isoform X1 [Theropithecus gelada]XP_0252
MTFSEILDRVGSMGRFQFLHVAILGLPILNMANHNLLQIFTAATPVHHCRPPPNASAGPWVIPMGPNGKPERCLRFVHPSNASLPNDTQRSMEPCLDGWVYNSTKDSIVTEWNLVCNSNKLKEMAQSIFMAGILIGGLVLGDLSDRFGRRPILTCSYLLLAASGSGAAFSPTFPVYVVFRFLCGCGISGITLSTVILNVEWVPTRMRAIMSTALGYCYTVGQFILPGLAYAIPQWRWLQLTVSIPFFIFFLSSWWTPESIRWLVLTGKSSKALKILRRVAAFNGKKEEGERLSLEELKLNLQKEISLAKAKYTAADLFRIPMLRRMTFCLSLAWFATGFAYYSLAMGVEEFGVNLYILQIIFGGVDIPAKFITILSLSYLGRHTTQAAALLLAGGAILALTFVPLDLQTVRTVLAVFGKGCLSSSFSCLFLYTSELYPTVIRQTGMGVSNLWTRVGSMLSPLVKITGEVQPFIPNIIYGITALLGGSAALFLPETLNQPLPETIEDLENWSLRAKEPKQEPEVEKASQRIPLQPYGPDLGSS